MIAGISPGMQGGILDVLPVDGEGIYLILGENVSPCETIIRIGLVSPDGILLWQNESVTVRSDAVASVICPAVDGGILSANAFGSGYTDILLTRWSRTGTVLNTDTIAMQCYDAPGGLIQHDGGYILLWDSWSEDRGLHLAELDESGNVLETVFAFETIHPGATTLAGDENLFVVGISPLLAGDNPALIGYSSFGHELWSFHMPWEIQDSTDYIVALSLSDSGEQVALWKTLAGSGCCTTVSEDCELLEYYPSLCTEYAGATSIALYESENVIFSGPFTEESTFWIACTDLQGNLTQKLAVNRNLTPSKIIPFGNSSFLVTGTENDGEDGNILLRISSSGEVLWVFPVTDSS